MPSKQELIDEVFMTGSAAVRVLSIEPDRRPLAARPDNAAELAVFEDQEQVAVVIDPDVVFDAGAVAQAGAVVGKADGLDHGEAAHADPDGGFRGFSGGIL